MIGMRKMRGIALSLVVALLTMNAGQAQAMLAPPESPMAAATRAQDIQTVQSFLETKEVAQHLTGYGMTPVEVSSRLGNLSNQELHQVATKIERERPGGDTVVTVLVIGILVLLFIYLFKRV